MQEKKRSKSKKSKSSKNKMQIVCKKHNEPIVVLDATKRQFKCDMCLEEEGLELDPEYRITMKELKDHM